MASVSMKVDISQQALERAVNFSTGTRTALARESNAIAARANGMATEKTGIWHETGANHTPGKTGGTWHDHGGNYKTVGDQEARYGTKPVIIGKDGYIGIVYTANYAAIKDNHKNNTLLKAKG